MRKCAGVYDICGTIMNIDRQLLLHVIFWINAVCKVNASYIDYTENTELIQQRAGNDIKLNCGLKGLFSDESINGMKIHWYFKPCGDNAYQKSCHGIRSEDWAHLPCDEQFCGQSLHLKNVTEKYSGLYKCTIYPYKLDDVTTLDIQLVRTYQLDIKNSTILVPEFLDAFPENKTASIGSQVVFQCRVQSQVHPTIKWFKRIPDMSAGMEYPLGQENFNSHIVQYNGRTYELLQAAREKNIDDEIYLSKLILNGVRMQDEGFYACVAISYRGHRIREAFLGVEDNTDERDDEENANYWDDYGTNDERTDPKEFWLLFLMPVGLAMLPISFWLCYIVNKRCSEDKNGVQDEERSLHLSDMMRHLAAELKVKESQESA